MGNLIFYLAVFILLVGIQIGWMATAIYFYYRRVKEIQTRIDRRMRYNSKVGE